MKGSCGASFALCRTRRGARHEVAGVWLEDILAGKSEALPLKDESMEAFASKDVALGMRVLVEQGAKDNLAFLIVLRHEIERRSTNRIDDAVSAKLQACCINFNDTITKLFGVQYGPERRLPMALQFVTFSSDQRQKISTPGEP